MPKMAFTIADAMPRNKYGETSFSERLQNIREARGLTQVQLAEAQETTQRATYAIRRNGAEGARNGR